MQELRANTQVIVTVGPFVDVGDGFTPQVDITLGGNEAELIKHGATLVTDISAATWAAVANCRGYYSLTLTTSHTDTEGMLIVIVQDDSDCLPVKQEYMVLSQAAWDSKYAAKDTGYMDVNVKHWLDTAAHAATVAGIPVVQLHDSAGAGGINAPANFEDLAIVDTAGTVAVPTTQKVDVETIKTKAVAVDASGTTFPTGTIANTTNITGGVITNLAAAGQQDIAQIVKGTKGTVWFVATNGNDASDGLTPDTAKLSPKTTIEAAIANDLVILGPGVFALGENVIVIPNDVSVHGAGLGQTHLTSDHTAGAVLKLGTRSGVIDLTVEAIDSEAYCVGASTAQAAFTDARLERVRIIADQDGIMVQNASACTLIAIDCVLDVKYAGVTVAGTGAHRIDLVRPVIIAVGPSGSGSNTTYGVAVTGANAIARVFWGMIVAQAGNGSTIGLTTSGGTLEMYGGTIQVNDVTGTVKSLWNISGTIRVCGVDYDRSLTTGTITVSSGLDAAMAASPVANSLMQRIQALDLLTEAGGAGDLAAMLLDTGTDGVKLAASQHVIVDSGTITAYTGNTPQTANHTATLTTIAGDVAGLDGAAMRGTDSAALASVCTEVRLAELAAVNLPADIDGIKAKTALLPSGIEKAIALTAYPFLMIDSTDHLTPKTGLTVTAQISKDGGAFAACTNVVAEIGSGLYKISLTATEMTADTLALRFTATGADQALHSIITST